ncbi:hypothetical protein ACEXQE_06150 [Herbiconiux sp. P17]|uniref:hypothetical protein n=1 Tax=Herbiconiux wuyangfengii TaxID=3342794 RepID=UPI0035B83DE0
MADHTLPDVERRPATFDDDAFERLLAEAREGAAARERERALPHDLVRRLVDTGFASGRVPAVHGGEGISLRTQFRRLIALASADSNVAHVFRGHLAFVEQRHFDTDPAAQALWYERVLGGGLVGNAQSEQTGTTDLATTLAPVPGGFRLDGRKFYTTGSIYADWIDLSAHYDGEDRQIFVSTAADGVQSIDDWAGFGQQLTGSGTTVFDNVFIDPADVRSYADDDEYKHPYLMGYFQLVLLAVVAGIADAAVRDTVEYVRPRSRTFGVAGTSSPREDPLVQSVVGGLSSAAHAARAIVLESATALDEALADYLAGAREPERFVAAQLDVYRAQQTVLPIVIAATSELFEVGGASAVDRGKALDRHWRNARTIASHNPAINRKRTIGEFELNGTGPDWMRAAAK